MSYLLVMDNFSETNCSKVLPLNALAGLLIDLACSESEQTWGYERDCLIEETFLAEDQSGIVPPWFEGMFSLPVLF